MQVENMSIYQVAELMGSEADERDACILLGILFRERVTNTANVPEAQRCEFLAEVAEQRKRDDELMNQIDENLKLGGAYFLDGQ